MKVWLLAIADIPGEVISLLILLLISLISWLKNRAGSSQEFEEPVEDPYREVIWKRQVGEETEGHPWETRAEPPPLPPVAPPPLQPKSAPANPAAPAAPAQPWQRPKSPTVSRKDADLAEAFERSTRRTRLSAGRSSHRRQIDALLRSPSAAQNAVLLREILGPPVALRTDRGDQPT